MTSRLAQCLSLLDNGMYPSGFDHMPAAFPYLSPAGEFVIMCDGARQTVPQKYDPADLVSAWAREFGIPPGLQWWLQAVHWCRGMHRPYITTYTAARGRAVPNWCGGCGACSESVQLMQCTDCRRVLYCSVECQARARLIHRPICHLHRTS